MRTKGRAGSLLPVLLITTAAIVAAAGCYSSSYRRGIEANVQLVCDLSNKLYDYSRVDFQINGRPISSEEMGEFYYSLKKARAYGAMSERESSRRSYRDFERLLDTYAQFVRAADQYRLQDRRDEIKLAALKSQRDEIGKLSDLITAELRSEAH